MAACALAAISLALTASSAQASFPGANGKIAFGRCEDGSDCYVGRIWTMNADGSGQARLFNDPGHWDDDPSYSADGHRIAFQRCTEGASSVCGIATIDAHGHEVRQLTTGAHPIGDDYPTFSPDGSRIAFMHFNTVAQVGEIWVMGADGSGAHRLTSSNSDSVPEFSPDGTKIAFRRISSDQMHIWLMNADGSNQHSLASAPDRKDSYPSFSPDGTKIAFAGCPLAGPCAIWVVAVNGAGAHQVTTPSTRDSEPAFSPDGKRVVFSRDLPGGMTTQLYSQALSGGGPTRLTSGDEFRPSWSRVPAPSIDSPPKIAGLARAGHALAATLGPGSWGGTASLQWLRCAAACSLIPGATAATYKPTNADIGSRLQVRQTQTSAGGSVSAVSAASTPVAAEPGARILGLVRAGRASLLARLGCPATQSVVCNGRLTLTARLHGHSVKVAAGKYQLAAGTTAKLTLRATKALGKAKTVTARLITRDDAGNITKSKRTVTLKHN